ncbi:hypothetical protein ILYODFUR_036350 [Ilyodon furcidens]|uniref:Uncharacterized protein n=1 Tax=Ilyodon furcidens TaxID=33524 RepID=A0ABV0SSV4_9TELE
MINHNIQDQVSSVIKQTLFHQPSGCSIGSSTNISPSPSLIALSLWSSQKFKTIQTDNTDAKRECLRQALSVYLNEDPEKVVKERMDSDVDKG